MKKLSLLVLIASLIISLCPTSYGAPLGDSNEMATLYNNENYKGCVALADDILEDSPGYMDALYYKAAGSYALGDLSAAFDACAKMLSLNPLNEYAMATYVQCAISLNMPAEALSGLENLVSAYPHRKRDIYSLNVSNNIVQDPKYKKYMAISIVAGGMLLDLDVEPVTSNNRTLIPMRAAFEALDAEVSWNEPKKTAKAIFGTTTIEITLDSTQAVVNNKPVKLDAPAVMQDNRVLVPVRFVSERLSAKVKWSEEDQVVYIDKAVPSKGKLNYDIAKAQLDFSMTALPVNGTYANPYNLEKNAGLLYLTLCSRKQLDTFELMTAANRSAYVVENLNAVHNYLADCEQVSVNIVFEGKIYYEQSSVSKNGKTYQFNYYFNGKPINLVKQNLPKNNYTDFYMLPQAEQFELPENTNGLFDITPKNYIFFDNNAIQTLHQSARNSFELTALPVSIGEHSDAWLHWLNNEEEFSVEINKVWRGAAQAPVKEYIKKLTKSSDPFLLTVDKVNKTMEDVQLSYDEIMKISIAEYDKNKKMAVLDMTDIDKANTCSYIAIAARNNFTLEYYMLGRKSNNTYRLVMYWLEATTDLSGKVKYTRCSYDLGLVENNIDAFVNAVLKVASKPKYLDIDKTTSTFKF